MGGHQISNAAQVSSYLAVDHSSIGKELEVRNQRQLIQAGSESFPVNAIFQRREQIPHAGNIVSEKPFFLGKNAKKVAYMTDQCCRKPINQGVNKVLVDTSECQFFEGGHAKGILGTGAQRGWNEDEKWLTQLAIRVRVTQFHQLGGGHPERHAFLVMAAKDENIAVGPSAAQFLAN